MKRQAITKKYWPKSIPVFFIKFVFLVLVPSSRVLKENDNFPNAFSDRLASHICYNVCIPAYSSNALSLTKKKKEDSTIFINRFLFIFSSRSSSSSSSFGYTSIPNSKSKSIPLTLLFHVMQKKEREWSQRMNDRTKEDNNRITIKIKRSWRSDFIFGLFKSSVASSFCG